MINLSALSKFIVKVLIFYLTFMLIGNYSNSIKLKFTKTYINQGNNFFKTFASHKKVKFKTVKDKNWLIKIQAFDTKAGKNNWCELNIWGIIYLPVMLFVSLILASNFKRWWHKLIASIVGLSILLLYFYYCTYFKIIYLFHTIDKSEPGFTGGTFYDIVNRLNLSFIDNVNVYLIFTLVIWFLVAFRKENFTSQSTD